MKIVVVKKSDSYGSEYSSGGEHYFGELKRQIRNREPSITLHPTDRDKDNLEQLLILLKTELFAASWVQSVTIDNASRAQSIAIATALLELNLQSLKSIRFVKVNSMLVTAEVFDAFKKALFNNRFIEFISLPGQTPFQVRQHATKLVADKDVEGAHPVNANDANSKIVVAAQAPQYAILDRTTLAAIQGHIERNQLANDTSDHRGNSVVYALLSMIMGLGACAAALALPLVFKLTLPLTVMVASAIAIGVVVTLAAGAVMKLIDHRLTRKTHAIIEEHRNQMLMNQPDELSAAVETELGNNKRAQVLDKKPLQPTVNLSEIELRDYNFCVTLTHTANPENSFGYISEDQDIEAAQARHIQHVLQYLDRLNAQFPDLVDLKRMVLGEIGIPKQMLTELLRLDATLACSRGQSEQTRASAPIQFPSRNCSANEFSAEQVVYSSPSFADARQNEMKARESNQKIESEKVEYGGRRALRTVTPDDKRVRPLLHASEQVCVSNYVKHATINVPQDEQQQLEMLTQLCTAFQQNISLQSINFVLSGSLTNAAAEQIALMIYSRSYTLNSIEFTQGKLSAQAIATLSAALATNPALINFEYQSESPAASASMDLAIKRSLMRNLLIDVKNRIPTRLSFWVGVCVGFLLSAAFVVTVLAVGFAPPLGLTMSAFLVHCCMAITASAAGVGMIVGLLQRALAKNGLKKCHEASAQKTFNQQPLTVKFPDQQSTSKLYQKAFWERIGNQQTVKTKLETDILVTAKSTENAQAPSTTPSPNQLSVTRYAFRCAVTRACFIAEIGKTEPRVNGVAHSLIARACSDDFAQGDQLVSLLAKPPKEATTHQAEHTNSAVPGQVAPVPH